MEEKISQDEALLAKAIKALAIAVYGLADKTFISEVSNIVKVHMTCAAVAAAGSAWIPVAGSTIALLLGSGSIWSMYFRINKRIGIAVSKKILKSLGAGILSNLSSALMATLAGAILSFLPIGGQIASPMIMGTNVFAMTFISAIIYVKILTKIFKEGVDPTTLNAKDWRTTAEEILKNEDIKILYKKGKEEYKKAKKEGELKKEKKLELEKDDD